MTRLVRIIGIVVLAVGLSAQAAQAKPFEYPGSAKLHMLALPHNSSNSGLNTQGTASGRGAEMAEANLHRAVFDAPVTHTGNGGANWTAILGGAAIIVLVGALGTVAFRRQLGRPATA